MSSSLSSLTNVNLSSILENDLWGLNSFTNEIKKLKDLLERYQTINSRITLLQSTLGLTITSSMIIIQIQKWRRKNLLEEINLLFEELQQEILYIEEIIRYWLEGVIMKKWKIRNSVLTIIEQINFLIEENQKKMLFYRLKEEECEKMKQQIKKEIQLIDYQFNFLEVENKKLFLFLLLLLFFLS